MRKREHLENASDTDNFTIIAPSPMPSPALTNSRQCEGGSRALAINTRELIFLVHVRRYAKQSVKRNKPE